MKGQPGLTGVRRARYYSALWQVAGMFDQIAPRGSEITEVRAQDQPVLTRSYPLINLGTIGTHLTTFIKPRERQVFDAVTGELCREELSLEFTRFPLDDAEQEVANFSSYTVGIVAVNHGCQIVPTETRYHEVRAMRDALQLVTGALALRSVCFFDTN